MRLFNWDLFAHPANWAIVWMMVVIPMIAVHLFLTWETSSDDNAS